jgi:hypothetical protein
MKQTGYLLLAGGFLVAAFSTALDTVATNWNLFVPAALAGMVGVYSIKRHARGEARSEQVLTANRAELKESLGNIVSNLEQLNEAGDVISTANLRVEIDSRLRDDLRRFADARESLIHLFGLQAYANVMSDFAAAMTARLVITWGRRQRNSVRRGSSWIVLPALELLVLSIRG